MVLKTSDFYCYRYPLSQRVSTVSGLGPFSLAKSLRLQSLGCLSDSGGLWTTWSKGESFLCKTAAVSLIEMCIVGHVDSTDQMMPSIQAWLVWQVCSPKGNAVWATLWDLNLWVILRLKRCLKRRLKRDFNFTSRMLWWITTRGVPRVKEIVSIEHFLSVTPFLACGDFRSFGLLWVTLWYLWEDKKFVD